MLPHEKLDVDRKALAFVGDASTSAARWDKRPAVADQFGRASDSLVLNLAEGARLRPGRAKLRTLDDALGVRWMAGKILLERIVAMLSRMGAESPRRSSGGRNSWSGKR